MKVLRSAGTRLGASTGQRLRSGQASTSSPKRWKTTARLESKTSQRSLSTVQPIPVTPEPSFPQSWISPKPKKEEKPKSQPVPRQVEDVASKTAMPDLWEEYLAYHQGMRIPITSTLKIVKPEDDTPAGVWPAFRLMEQNGRIRDSTVRLRGRFNNRSDLVQGLDSVRSRLARNYPKQAGEISNSGLLHPSKFPFVDTNSDNTLLRAYEQIIKLREMDDILLNAQRQGRISFYLTCRGEEAIHMGAASAVDVNDPVFAQYREQGVLMWRGFTLEQFTNQCFANRLDLGKGRQMPIHYGSRALNYHTVSSPLGTQLPQAVGAAYRLKLTRQENVVICFFGDGCASTTDFHSALNFAATLKTPVIFFCRNNGYAISTPTKDQYAGDGIISRAPGYGVAGIRVDGNDVLAVHAAVREAKKYALEKSAPVLIEAMTYRQGHHSTSDDSSQYRSTDEVKATMELHDPLDRIVSFLEIHGIAADDVASLRKKARMEVIAAMEKAEKQPKPPLKDLFSDVYKEIPPRLQRQKENLEKHLKKYPEEYH